MQLLYYACDVRDHDAVLLYKAFGKMVRLHRERQSDLTQEKLGGRVGLSRTSITNIEKGRQHVALHQIYAIADALNVPPEVLLPKLGGDGSLSWVSDKLPPGTDKQITEWASKIVGDQR